MKGQNVEDVLLIVSVEIAPIAPPVFKVPNLCLYWLLSLGFLWIDIGTSETGKLFVQRTNVPLEK